MATPITLDKGALNSALKYIWSQYRTWAITSQKFKNDVTRWRDRVLLLSIGGAILGTLSQQLIVWGRADASSWSARGLGFVSAVALALAAYFTREIFGPDLERKTVRARVAAEALKSQAFLLATGAPPYDIATTDNVLVKPDKVKKAVENLAPVGITDEQKVERILSVPMSVNDYVEQRVDDQLKFYARQAVENAEKIARARKLSLILGAAAVVLGVIATTHASVAGWIAVIGTVTAAIAARQSAGRYYFLIVSYQAAREKLEELKARWDIGSIPHHQFILACEEVISTENSSWMAEWTKDNAQPEK